MSFHLSSSLNCELWTHFKWLATQYKLAKVKLKFEGEQQVECVMFATTVSQNPILANASLAFTYFSRMHICYYLYNDM